MIPMQNHKTSRLLWIVLAVSIAGVGLAMLLMPRPDASTDQATVAVTSNQLADIVRSVAGPDIAVVTILPPGANSHTFEPTPATLASIRNAKVVYAVGHGFDAWVNVLVADLRLPVMTVDRGVPLRASGTSIGDGAAADEEDGDGPIDPHYWLDARNAATIAATVAEDLSARFPDRREEIITNLEATRTRLLAADAEIRSILSGLVQRDIVTLHDAWYYFADAYGLHVVGSFEPSAAREPSPQ